VVLVLGAFLIRFFPGLELLFVAGLKVKFSLIPHILKFSLTLMLLDLLHQLANLLFPFLKRQLRILPLRLLPPKRIKQKQKLFVLLQIRAIGLVRKGFPLLGLGDFHTFFLFFFGFFIGFFLLLSGLNILLFQIFIFQTLLKRLSVGAKGLVSTGLLKELPGFLGVFKEFLLELAHFFGLRLPLRALILTAHLRRGPSTGVDSSGDRPRVPFLRQLPSLLRVRLARVRPSRLIRFP